MKKRHHLLVAILTMVFFSASCREEEPAVPDPPSGNEGGNGYGFAPHTPVPVVLDIPANMPPMPIPPDNPLTEEGIALGRFLFYEERLSGDNTMSCAQCHAPAHAFTDGNAVSVGIDGIAGNRSSMPLINLGYAQSFFWDGRVATLEEQILNPVRNPIEMHEIWPDVVSKLQADTAYVKLFWDAFGTTTVDSLLAAKAVAQFLRTLISANSPWDKWRRFEGTIPLDAQIGYDLFKMEGGPVGMPFQLPGMDSTIIGQGGADCFHCHVEAAGLFTDEQFHNNGLDSEPFADLGRGGFNNDPFDNGKFKTPTLRNIMLSAPYMHDGRFATIEEVLDHYNDGGHPSSTVDSFMKFTDPDLTLELDATKRAQILAFLNTLTDTEFIENPAFADPGPPHWP